MLFRDEYFWPILDTVFYSPTKFVGLGAGYTVFTLRCCCYRKKKGHGINTVLVIPHCNSLMSITLLFFLSILLNNFRNLVII